MEPTRGRGRRLLAFGAKSLFALIFFLVLLEGAVRLAPRSRTQLANDVYTAYGFFPGGTYYHEPISGIAHMRANHRVENYWNGYRWWHETDEAGFRNPPGIERAEVLLLGDSFIYGHGVEGDETVAQVLRLDHGRSVYDLSRQGDSLYDHYVKLRLYLDRFEPREVILFVFNNDFSDLLAVRTPEQIERRPETESDYPRAAEHIARLADDPPYPAWMQLYRLRSFRLAKGLLRMLRGGIIAPAWATDVPPILRPFDEADQLALVTSYYERTVAELADRARERGVRLSVVYLDLNRSQLATARVHAILGPLCAELGIGFYDTRELFAPCGACFLPHDGHFTPEGHRRLAAFLDRVVLAD